MKPILIPIIAVGVIVALLLCGMSLLSKPADIIIEKPGIVVLQEFTPIASTNGLDFSPRITTTTLPETFHFNGHAGNIGMLGWLANLQNYTTELINVTAITLQLNLLNATIYNSEGTSKISLVTEWTQGEKNYFIEFDLWNSPVVGNIPYYHYNWFSDASTIEVAYTQINIGYNIVTIGTIDQLAKHTTFDSTKDFTLKAIGLVVYKSNVNSKILIDMNILDLELHPYA